MPIKTRTELNDYSDLYLDTNGTQAITGAILNAWVKDMADSAVNKNGDTGILGVLRYNSVLSISNDADLVHKKYVDDAVSSIDLSGYIKLDGTSSATTGDIDLGNGYGFAWGAGDAIVNSSGIFVLSSSNKQRFNSATGVYEYVNTGSFTGILNFNSNTANRTYTFPDATGTIALTSNLSAYLPLSGGTLSGNLNGVTPTEIGYLSGVTSSIQNQINNINAGINAKAAVRVATTANITLSGTQTIDGVSVIAGDRVLVKNQSTGSQNGIYVCAAGAWSRATDATTGGTGSTGVLGMTVVISEGSTLADQMWMCTTDAPITIGTTALTFVKSSNTTYTGSNGITLTGNNFTLDNSYFTGDVTVSAGVTAIGAGKVTNTMLASMTSAQLAGVISDETGTGLLVFSASPTFTGTPILATPSATSISMTGTAGTGFTEMIAQSSRPAAVNGSVRLYSTSTSGFGYIKRNLANSADIYREFSFPDQNVSVTFPTPASGTASTLAGVNTANVFTQNQTVPDGAAATPALNFNSDPTSGFFYSTSGGAGVYVVVAGSSSMKFGTTNTSNRNLIPSANSLTLGFDLGSSEWNTAYVANINRVTVAGSNSAGGNLTISPGTGRGTGTGASIIFQTPTATTSGSTVQTQTTRLTIAEVGITISDAINIVLNTTTGTKIGTATSQKLGFWNATPVIQPTTGIAASSFTANTSGILNDTGTWGGYTIGQIVAALKQVGILA